jgi:hypothetical protein
MSSKEVVKLTEAVSSLTDLLQILIRTLEEIHRELEWANNRGPSYTITETIAQRPDEDEALCQ